LGQHLHRHDPIVASGISTDGGYAAGLAGGPDTSRRCPPSAAPEWLGRIFILGALNFTLFWAALFISAYRLPGGVAATLGATPPLIVLLLSRPILGARIEPVGLCAALAGIVGVGLLILGPQAKLDPIGAAAALVGALSMGTGTVLTRRWQMPASPLTVTAWQLTAGGLLLPIALVLEPGFPMPTATNFVGLLWLGLIGAALTYFLWFRGIAQLGPATATSFGFLSPLTAVLLGWLFLAQALGLFQMIGAGIVLVSVWLGQRSGLRALASTTARLTGASRPPYTSRPLPSAIHRCTRASRQRLRPGNVRWANRMDCARRLEDAPVRCNFCEAFVAAAKRIQLRVTGMTFNRDCR
jgi:probable blue pigment (indigoidine) exporter